MTTSIRYRVTVTWDGVKRATDLDEESARFTVVDAVRRGHEVTCVALNVGEEPINAVLDEHPQEPEQVLEEPPQEPAPSRPSGLTEIGIVVAGVLIVIFMIACVGYVQRHSEDSKAALRENIGKRGCNATNGTNRGIIKDVRLMKTSAGETWVYDIGARGSHR